MIFFISHSVRRQNWRGDSAYTLKELLRIWSTYIVNVPCERQLGHYYSEIVTECGLLLIKLILLCNRHFHGELSAEHNYVPTYTPCYKYHCLF